MTEEIIRIVASVLNIEPDQISPGEDLMETLGADSIDIVEVIALLEDMNEIFIPDDVIPDLRCINDISACVESLINGKE